MTTGRASSPTAPQRNFRQLSWGESRPIIGRRRRAVACRLILWLLVAAVVLPAVPLRAPTAAAQSSETREFCIIGVSTAVGWSYEIRGSIGSEGAPPATGTTAPLNVAPVEFTRTINPGPPAGGSGAQFALQWSADIQAYFKSSLPAASSMVDPRHPNCFSISGIANLRFFVGAIGRASDCEITASPRGCSFNPVIIPAYFPPSSPQAGYAAIYYSGWNLVAAPPGTLFTGAGSLYTWQDSDTTYEVLPDSSGVTGGLGYWADFSGVTSSPPIVFMPAAVLPFTVAVPCGKWVLIGNPALQTVNLTYNGSPFTAFIYDAYLTMAYQQTTMLPVGQGAWAKVTDPGCTTTATITMS